MSRIGAFVLNYKRPMTCLALVAVCAVVHASTTHVVEQTSHRSSVAWGARVLKDGKASIRVLVPAKATTESLPIDVTVLNQGEAPIRFGDTGFGVDCKVTLQTESGREVHYSQQGKHYFQNEAGFSQYAIVELPCGQARNWEMDLVECFQPLEPGVYLLTLETEVATWDAKKSEFSQPVKFAATQLQVIVE